MTHDVISAFLDDEPFDPGALGRALAEPGGRELLLDLMALRALVQEEPSARIAASGLRAPATERRRAVAMGFAAATLIFTIGGGLFLSSRRIDPPHTATTSPATTSEADVPPTPDRVVSFEPGLDWHEPSR